MILEGTLPIRDLEEQNAQDTVGCRAQSPRVKVREVSRSTRYTWGFLVGGISKNPAKAPGKKDAQWTLPSPGHRCSAYQNLSAPRLSLLLPSALEQWEGQLVRHRRWPRKGERSCPSCPPTTTTSLGSDTNLQEGKEAFLSGWNSGVFRMALD